MVNKKLKVVVLWLGLMVAGLSPSLGQGTSFLKRQQLTGEWGGLRSQLSRHGITFSSTFIGDGMANLRGGLQSKMVFLDNWDAGISIDTDRLWGWRGGYVHVSVMQNNGGQPSKYIGDVQTANNIEAVRTIRIYEAWLQQNLFDNRLSLLAGLYELNVEFDYLESASLFINSSQGVGGALAASGLVGPPTFPATAPTARIKVMPEPRYYIQAAVSDGVPGVEHVSWDPFENGGTIWMAEMGFLAPLANNDNISEAFASRTHIGRDTEEDYNLKVALGGWMYSRNFVARRFGISRSPEKNERGLYVILDMRSLSWLHRGLDALSWHAQLGLADSHLSRIHLFLGSGLTYRDIPGDPSGVAGFSVSAVQNSKVYGKATGDTSDFEIALEWTYRTSITPWLHLQPDIQHIINPGMVDNTHNAMVAGLRMEFSL